jgi:AAA domain
MGWLNGKDSAGASVPPPAPTVEPQRALVTPDRSSNSNPFAKAVKYNAKGRVALIGPAGGGKSFTALVLARALAGPNGKIAAIDTEHGSLSKYADLFDFDVLELDSFSPESFIEALHAAEQAGYDVFLCDSLSHFWTGKDGAFDFVDMAAKRHKDQMGGWKDFRPHERLMVDELITSPCHVICTMRTKTDYQDQVDAQGRKKRIKIGLAPVQRDGLEYEFDLVGYLDEDNSFVVDKTRCPAYSQKALAKPDAKAFAPFVDWLKGAARGQAPPYSTAVTDNISTGGHPRNTRAAAQHVADQKIAAGNPHSGNIPFRSTRDMADAFKAVREKVGEIAWLAELERYGWRSFQDMRNALDAKMPNVREKIAECYWHLDALARKEVA